MDNFLYLTIGTGIGGGGVFNGRPLHGLVHPEMGHIRIPHDWNADPYGGFCPYHGDCFEGLAAGPALHKRWGLPGDTLPPDHPAWPLEAHYIALALQSFICTLSPTRIILAGRDAAGAAFSVDPGRGGQAVEWIRSIPGNPPIHQRIHCPARFGRARGCLAPLHSPNS